MRRTVFRRTVYLSFDLTKAEERACYLFLVKSDRAKKKIICTLLTNSGMVNPKVIITEEELPKIKKNRNYVKIRQTYQFKK